MHLKRSKTTVYRIFDPDVTTGFLIETMHTYNPHEGEPRDYNNPQILHHRVRHVLQIKFELMHKQVLSEFNSAAENK
jgi:hypothetical protein